MVYIPPWGISKYGLYSSVILPNFPPNSTYPCSSSLSSTLHPFHRPFSLLLSWLVPYQLNSASISSIPFIPIQQYRIFYQTTLTTHTSIHFILPFLLTPLFNSYQSILLRMLRQNSAVTLTICMLPDQEQVSQFQNSSIWFFPHNTIHSVTNSTPWQVWQH